MNLYIHIFQFIKWYKTVTMYDNGSGDLRSHITKKKEKEKKTCTQ